MHLEMISLAHQMMLVKLHTVFENYSKCRIWIFWIMAFSINFCPIKSDLSGNTVWPHASGFQKLAKMDHFWHFWWTFVHSKCKCSPQSWMRLFCRFSNTVCTDLSMQYIERAKNNLQMKWTHFSFEMTNCPHLGIKNALDSFLGSFQA